MDDPKVDGAGEPVTDEALSNFGNAPAGDGLAPREKYIANFEGDEIAGKRYGLGEEIADDVDAGTIAYLVQIGRITPKSATDSDATSLGEGANDTTGTGANVKTPAPAAEDPFASYDLTDEEKAEAEQLKADNNAEQLREEAANAGVELESDDNKSDMAAKIVISRRA